MTRFALHIALSVAAVALTAGCESPPVTGRTPRSVALILSGDVVGYSSTGAGPRVSVVDIDGTPAKEPYGPLELAPGRHTVTLACDDAKAPHTLTVKAGEVYQFVVRTTPNTKGCTGALSRVRSTNP